MGEPLYTNLHDLVSDLLDDLAPQLATPYAFFGHSMGAVIAFELARAIRRRDIAPPVHLFLSARRALHIPSREEPCHHLPDSEFAETLIKRYNGIPKTLLEQPAMLQFFLPVVRADFTLIETYRYMPEPPLDQPITTFGGTEDDGVTPDDLDGWQQLTLRPIRRHMLPGGHFFLQNSRDPLLKIIASELGCNSQRDDS